MTRNAYKFLQVGDSNRINSKDTGDIIQFDNWMMSQVDQALSLSVSPVKINRTTSLHR